MNMPAANATMNGVNPSTAFARKIPAVAPSIAVTAERKLNKSAFFLEKPAYSSIPKSATSCGTSWRMMDIVAAIPSGMLTR